MSMLRRIISNKAGKRVRWTRKRFPEDVAAVGVTLKAPAFIEWSERDLSTSSVNLPLSVFRD